MSPHACAGRTCAVRWKILLELLPVMLNDILLSAIRMTDAPLRAWPTLAERRDVPIEYRKLMVCAAGALLLVAAEPLIADLDAPVMPGFSEDDSQHVSFDEEDGRIVQAALRGAVSPGAALDYYGAALPALGWRLLPASDTATLRFERDGERLTLRVGVDKALTVLLFDLRPRQANRAEPEQGR